MIYTFDHRMVWLIAAVMVLVVAPAGALAQDSGEVAGSVYDQTGAALSGAALTLRGAASREAQSGPSGDFAFRNLAAGDYEVTAHMAGFEAARRTVHVQAGQRLAVSLTLRVAFVEEALVTAAKSGERDVHSVPMAVTAVSNAELARLGTETLSGATALAPSVTLSQNNAFGQLTIRGIGTNAVNAGSDPSSALYLDGVYLGRPGMAFVQLLDLDRIEVMRGPQGTLYGRNAVGGAVNLVTRQPTNELQASSTLTGGNFAKRRVEARLSGPIARDRVMGAAAFVRGLEDGYVRDLQHPDQPLGGDDVMAARGQLRVVFDRRTSLLLSSDADHQDARPLTFNKVLAVKPGFQLDNPPDLHDVRSSAQPSADALHYGGSARLTTTLTPSTTLTSLTAYRSLDYEFFVDADVSELDLLTTHMLERQHQLSEELTLSHQRAGLTWIVGAFFFDEHDHQSYWVDQMGPRTQVRLDPRVDASSRAVFGQTTIGVTSRVSATAGIRYTSEGKDIANAGGRYGLDAPGTAVAGSVYDYADSISHSAWTPKVGVELRLPHDSLAYVSATRGFKSGGFNPSATVPRGGYAPEWAWSYEGGLKSALRNGRSRLAVSVFHMDYTDLQVQTPIGIGVFDIRNAAAATIRGLEVENTTRLGHGVETGGHLTWLDARYDSYVAVSNSNVTGDVSGNRLNNAPEWAGRVWVEWARDVGRSRRLSLAMDATAQSRVFYTPFNDDIQRQGAYGLLGGRIEYGPGHRRWVLGAYVRNLNDADYITASFGTAPTAFGGRPGPSRQFAVDFTIRR